MIATRRFAAAAFLACGALGLVACGADPYPGQDDDGTLRVALVSEMNGFDPAQASEEIRTICVLNTYDALYAYRYLERPYALEPCLASADPTVSADGKTWTISIRPGIRYVDDPCFVGSAGIGRELTAHDAVFCFLRLMDAHQSSPGSWILEGRVAGLDAFVEASAKTPVDPSRSSYAVAEGYPEDPGIRAIDAHTLEIRLTAPYPQLKWVLAMPYASIYPPEAVAYYGAEFLNHAVGTGPYRIAEYRPAQRLVLERNPTYREEFFPTSADPAAVRGGLAEEAGKRLPQNERVIATVMKEDQPRWLYFESGFLDRVGIPKDSFDSAIEGDARELKARFRERGVALWKEPQLEVIYDAFNMQDPVVGKGERAKAIRRAASLATDYDWAVANLYNGRAEDMAGPIPRDCAEYDPEFVNSWKKAAGETREQALERARKILADAGAPGGAGIPDITVDVLDSATDDDHFRAWKRDLEAIGLRLRPFKTTWQGMDKRVQGGESQIFGQAWFGDYPDAQNFLQLFYGPNKPPNPNGANYQNPEYDKLYESTVEMQPGPERTAIYRRLQRMVVEDCPWVVRYRRIIYYLQQPWLHGWRPTDLSQKFFKYARIDVAARRRGTAALNVKRPAVPLLVAGGFLVLVAATLVAGRRRRRGW